MGYSQWAIQQCIFPECQVAGSSLYIPGCPRALPAWYLRKSWEGCAIHTAALPFGPPTSPFPHGSPSDLYLECWGSILLLFRYKPKFFHGPWHPREINTPSSCSASLGTQTFLSSLHLSKLSSSLTCVQALKPLHVHSLPSLKPRCHCPRKAATFLLWLLKTQPSTKASLPHLTPWDLASASSFTCHSRIQDWLVAWYSNSAIF